MRAALLHLGLVMSAGEVTLLVRRFGGYVPNQCDAVCSLPQFGALFNHLKSVGVEVRNPFLSSHPSDVLPAPLAAGVDETLAARSAALARQRSLAWYGFRPQVSAASGLHSIY